MSVIVHVEAPGGRIDHDALGVLAAVRAAGVPVSVVLVGNELAAATVVVGRFGPVEIFVFDDPVFATPVLAPRVAALVSLFDRYPDGGRWFASTSTLTTEVAAALSARTGAGLAWGLSAVRVVDGALVVRRLSGSDTVQADISWATAWGIGLFRSHSFEPVEAPEPGSAMVHRLAVPAFDDRGVTLTERPVADSSPGMRLDQSNVIVAAGRGIGEAAHLATIVELAELLGGVAGVSLPLVEMGWAPRSMQVGQTGTIVAPLLYVACGISGQIQHRVGMERSGTIIAINTDPEAPIMGFCDLAVVADAKAVVPALIELLRSQTRTDGQETP